MEDNVRNSGNVIVKFSPWDENKFKISYLHIWEKIGGDQPGGTAELFHSGDQDASNFITTQQTGTIEIIHDEDGGNSYKFNIFITKREFFNNILKISFAILPGTDLERGKNFYTKNESETFNNIIDAVKSVWKGEIDMGVDSDIDDSIKIFQKNETGWKFLTRLGHSWKWKSAFAFGWDGLLFRDLEKDTEEIIVGDSGLWYQTSTTPIKYNKLDNDEVFDPWTNENKDDKTSISISTTGEKNFENIAPKLVRSSVSLDRYRIHANGYDRLEKNYECNVNFKGYSNISLTGQGMPTEWKLGDLVLYKRMDTAEEGVGAIKCIVAANEMFYSQNGASQTGPHGYPFEWTTILWGLEKMPASEELQNNDENQNE